VLGKGGDASLIDRRPRNIEGELSTAVLIWARSMYKMRGGAR